MNANREVLSSSEALENDRDMLVSANLEFIGKRMRQVLSQKSVGGNAGCRDVNGRKFSCAGVNFYYDNRGVIVEMGNIQNLSPEVKKYNKGTIRIGKIFNKDEKGQLVDISALITDIYLSGHNIPNFTEVSLIIERTKLQYNIAHSKTVEDLFSSLDLYENKLYDSQGRELEVQDYLKPVIIKVVQGESDPRFLTSNYGLRDCVIKLRDKFLQGKAK